MTTLAHSSTFAVESSNRPLGYNLPQRIGRILWLPMLLMAVTAFAGAFALAVVRADEIADGGSAATIAALKHVVAALMFLGFASVFAAISFAIARILGQFRKGGGEVQEAAGRAVKTLRMPLTAKLFIALMATATMTILAAVILHFVFAGAVGSSPASLEDSEQRFLVLEGVRRVGVALYLLAITLGLATIVQVLRFQTIRLRELPEEAARN